MNELEVQVDELDSELQVEHWQFARVEPVVSFLVVVGFLHSYTLNPREDKKIV